MGYQYLDTGAMYRAVALYFIKEKLSVVDLKVVRQALDDLSIDIQFGKNQKQEILLNGEEVSEKIRESLVSEKVSEVAALPEVRNKMVDMQRKIGERKGIVMDGRDIGTVVFPNAELKIFLTADVNTRAHRRELELLEAGIPSDIESIKENLTSRDQADSSREMSPLKKATGAVEIDTSNLLFEDQVDRIVALAKDIIHEN